MTEERGVKVTDAFRNSGARRGRVAEQVVEAILSTPMLSRKKDVVFHADPHAGNLLYDEERREVVILDWALAQRLSLEMRRELSVFVAMMALRNREAAAQALIKLCGRGGRQRKQQSLAIRRFIDDFFKNLGPNRSPRVLEVMNLLDHMALNGVRFPAVMAMFRKVIFTLDGVLYDIAGPGVRLDNIIARDYLTRWLASYGTFLAPLSLKDWFNIQRSAVDYGFKALLSAVNNAA
jgi:predicted unusual protein kinase regulating ubiquinone biosynthesis (AarF/ABC1/UbiB family)